MIDPKQHWSEFIEWLQSHDSGRVYRGVTDKINHLLIPSIGRLPNYSLENEINLFEHFKLKSLLLTSKPYNDLEWLVMAQHHGLPTRLLDWSSNPLVAAFFAIKETYNKDCGRIYSIKPNLNSFIDLTTESSAFSIKSIHFLIPPVSTKRIELQNGLFSVHPIPERPALVGLRQENLSIIDKYHKLVSSYKPHLNSLTDADIEYLKTYDGNNSNYQEKVYSLPHMSTAIFDIPHECKSYFEQNIRALGIDESIFGDLDAIAKKLSSDFTRGSLPRVSRLKIDYSYARFKDILEGNLIGYFQDNIGEFLPHPKYILYDDSITISIEQIKLKPSRYEGDLTASFWIFAEPNLKNVDSIFYNDLTITSDIRNKYHSFKMNMDGKPGCWHKVSINARIKAHVIVSPSYDMITVRKVEFIDNDDFDYPHTKLLAEIESVFERMRIASEFYWTLNYEEKHIIENNEENSIALSNLLKRKS